MKNKYMLVLALLLLTLTGCKKDNSTEPVVTPEAKIQVNINDIPFPTESFLRIPYTLKLWEYEKQGMKLQKIEVLDEKTNASLLVIDGEDMPFIYKAPLKQYPFWTVDNITSYYTSIQLPIPLGSTNPEKIYHKFILKDTVNNKEVTVTGGSFTPRYSESPLVVASPVKVDRAFFLNQSTNAYHFYVMFFTGGKITMGERFAFDYISVNEAMDDMVSGDPKVNSNYFCYGDTIYAVANGKVVRIRDGRPENRGDAQDVTFSSADEYAGNYLSIDIGGGKYAYFAHCIPGSFRVTEGQQVTEGQPIALLGNSGNSTGPHLHFQITDGPELLFSKGLPFVLKSYTKVGVAGVGPGVHTTHTNSMMEMESICKTR